MIFAFASELEQCCIVITECVCSRSLCSCAIPFTRIDISASRRAFRFSAPSVWKSLPQIVLISDSVYWNLDLKLFICSGFHWTLIRPATSASEITTIWRYINFIIIIIKCKMLCERWKHTMASLGSIQSEITWSSWPSSYWIGALLALATVTRFNHHIVCRSVIPCGFHL